MREQERAWPASKKEARAEFLKRLRRTALATPPATVRAAAADMKRRHAWMQAADGGNIEEGGSGSQWAPGRQSCHVQAWALRRKMHVGRWQHGAPSVPPQCPLSARSVPAQCPL